MHTGRVIQEHKTNYLLSTETGELFAIVRGTFHAHGNFPKVGDYVTYEHTDDGAVIAEVQTRKSEIIRTSQARNKWDGGVKSEVLVANVDIIFIVIGLDYDFNVSRAERYASLAAQSNVRAVLLLNKCDTVTDSAPYISEIKQRLPALTVHAVSAATGQNMEVLYEYLHDDMTAVLLGSSGAGKSTMTNWLMQEKAQLVQGVREGDSRGRHTTTSRELFAIPTGGYLIDTPGMRELGVMGETEEVFTSIETLVRQCKFSDCDHEKSAGCAVQEAVKAGAVSEEQFANYMKLLRERHYVASKSDKKSEREFNENRKHQAQKGQRVLRAKYRSRGVK